MSDKSLHIDFETRATVDLRKSGVYVYAESEHTDVWCAAYCFGDGPVKLWKNGEPCPPEIKKHVESGGEIAAWNAAFERIIWGTVLARKHGWPKPKLEQYRCVMVQAMAMSLPAALGDAAAALGIENQKDMAGNRLAIQMSKPRKMIDGKPVWWDGEDRFNRLYKYCVQDVETEREADKRLVPLSDQERKVWVLDQKINDRGVKVDIELCKQASKIVEAATKKLDQEMARVTNGDVTACSQVQVLTNWIRAKGVSLDGISKDDITDLLGEDLPADVEAALKLRQEAAKASTAKIQALLNCVNSDGRARGLLQYHAASTGRWGGRRFQPQNLPRPEMEDPEAAIPALMTGDLAVVEMLYEKPLSVVSDCIRSMVRSG